MRILPAAALTLMAALAAARPAAAQPEETVLRLSETAEVQRAPDELSATLRAEARGSTAALAQDQVNRAIAAALERARTVLAVRATTGTYRTWRTEEPRGWQATQTITLRGEDAAPLLELAGTLQQQGLALSDLSWRLSPDAERATRAEATRMAIESLRRRAEAVAGQLGMTVSRIQELRLDAPRPPVPRPMAMTVARSERAMAPPSSVPEDATVMATAEADIVLRPAR